MFSFFSGVGVLDLAFEKCSYEIVFVNEYNKQFMDSYIFARNQLHISAPIYGYDCSSVEYYAKKKGKEKLIHLIECEREKGNLVGFIGGPPCPDFSVAGKNAGSTGYNGRLTKTYFDLICRCKPDFFVFENVKGLVRTGKHKSFYDEMKFKVRANSFIISDKLISSIEYGVPQYRERIFMVGVADALIPNQFTTNTNELSFDWAKYRRYEEKKLLKLKWPVTNKFGPDYKCEFNYNVPKKLTVEYWFNKNKVYTHINGNDIFMVKSGKNKIQTIDEGDTKGKSFKRLHRWRYSPTAAYGHNEVHLHPYKERRISVAEAMAIQSMPKDFVLPSNTSLSNKFKMIGNGVPYLMATAISKTLFDFLNDIQEEV